MNIGGSSSFSGSSGAGAGDACDLTPPSEFIFSFRVHFGRLPCKQNHQKSNQKYKKQTQGGGREAPAPLFLLFLLFLIAFLMILLAGMVFSREILGPFFFERLFFGPRFFLSVFPVFVLSRIP